jgi:hypothetical protein
MAFVMNSFATEPTIADHLAAVRPRVPVHCFTQGISVRLTPQGDARPSFVLNVGARQNLAGDRVSLTLAVSDLLKTQRQETELDVAGIQQRVTTRRDSQIVYAGLTYHYGRPEKKKDKPLQYEDQP